MAVSQGLSNDIPVAKAVRILLLERLAEFESVAADANIFVSLAITRTRLVSQATPTNH